jgi:hypothetical protein
VLTDDMKLSATSKDKDFIIQHPIILSRVLVTNNAGSGLNELVYLLLSTGHRQPHSYCCLARTT